MRCTECQSSYEYEVYTIVHINNPLQLVSSTRIFSDKITSSLLKVVK